MNWLSLCLSFHIMKTINVQLVLFLGKDVTSMSYSTIQVYGLLGGSTFTYKAGGNLCPGVDRPQVLCTVSGQLLRFSVA